jgi:hypothetical protein
MRPRVFTNSLYFEENLIANFKFIEITAFIWIPHLSYLCAPEAFGSFGQLHGMALSR